MFVQIRNYIGGGEDTIWDMYCVRGYTKSIRVGKKSVFCISLFDSMYIVYY